MLTDFRIILLPIFLNFVCIQEAIASVQAPLNYYQSQTDPFLSQSENFHLKQGFEKFRLGNFDYAWSEVAFMLHYYPNHPRALALMSDLSIKMNQTERATKYFERALTLFPNDASTSEMYSLFLDKIGKHQEAIAHKPLKISKKITEKLTGKT